jgi:hypothetical protein
MSSDVYVVRTTPVLSWEEALRACNEVAQQSDGVTFWAYRGDHSGATNAYFWHARRVAITVRIPELEEIEDDDVPTELRAPYVELSSGSHAWPWIEWMAYALARPLGARMYDPQEGSFFTLPKPTHDLAALRRMHDEYLREHTPVLAQSHWAFDVGEPTREGFRARVLAVEAVAREVLGIDASIRVRDDSVSVPGRWRAPTRFDRTGLRAEAGAVRPHQWSRVGAACERLRQRACRAPWDAVQQPRRVLTDSDSDADADADSDSGSDTDSVSVTASDQ